MPPERHTKIGLNIGTTSNLYRRSDVGCLDTEWRRNGITINLPHDPGCGSSGAVTMIGLAVDLDAVETPEDRIHLPGALESLATSVTMDAVSARLMRTLFVEAELHGCSDAFFDAGLDALFRRLSLGLAHAGDGEPSPLDERQLGVVRDLIEAHLATGLSVREMALALSMDQTYFAKRFRSSTGMAPFAYLTTRRMEHAKSMLGRTNKIIDVAQAVGYANPSKFAAAFRRYTGLAPRDWARRSRASFRLARKRIK